MSKHQTTTETVSEIRIDPQPSGLRAVFMVETRTQTEAREIHCMFEELTSRVQVKQLCKGTLVSYAVQAHESDAEILDEIEAVLKSSYGFVVTQRSFDDLIYRIVKELCEDTGSKLLPVSRCNICGRIEPFPNTVVSLTGADGSVLMSRVYCGRCTAQSVAPSNKEFIRSLLAADRRDLGKLAQAELVRHPSRKQPVRFRIKAEQ